MPEAPFKPPPKLPSPQKMLRSKLKELDNKLASSEETEELKRLATLVELQRKHRPWWQQPKVYWFLALLFFYFGVAGFLSRRQGETTVQLEAVVSSLSLKVSANIEPEPELATSGMLLSSLTFTSVSITLPRLFLENGVDPRDSETITLEVADEINTLCFTTMAIPTSGQAAHDFCVIANQELSGELGIRQVQPRGITLANVTLASGNDAVLSGSEGEPQFELRVISANPMAFRSTFSGDILVSSKEIPVGEIPFGLDVPTTEDSSIDFTLREADYELIEFNLPVDSLTFREAKDKKGDERLEIVSTIQEGSVYIESSDKVYTLRSGANLTFEKIKSGLVTSLRLLPDGNIKIQFRGIVSGLETGYPDRRVSLMPTHLEWFQARRLALLVLGGFIPLLTLMVPLLGFLGERK
jgi:hypothetical protein